MEQKVINCPHCGKIIFKKICAMKNQENKAEIKCPQCGSQRQFKNGWRQTLYGKIQRYLYPDCAYRLS